MKNDFAGKCTIDQVPGLLQEAAGIVNVALNALPTNSLEHEVASRFQEELVGWLKAVDLLGPADEVQQEITLKPNHLTVNVPERRISVKVGKVLVIKNLGFHADFIFSGNGRIEYSLDMAVDLIRAAPVARWLDAHVTTVANLDRVRIQGGWLAIEGGEE